MELEYSFQILQPPRSTLSNKLYQNSGTAPTAVSIKTNAIYSPIYKSRSSRLIQDTFNKMVHISTYLDQLISMIVQLPATRNLLLVLCIVPKATRF